MFRPYTVGGGNGAGNREGHSGPQRDGSEPCKAVASAAALYRIVGGAGRQETADGAFCGRPTEGDHGEQLARRPSLPPAQPPRAPLVRRQIRSNSKSGVYRALAREIFEKTERRATAAAIVDLMQQRGLAVADRKKEAAAAASALSSYAEFDNTSDAKGAGYGLRSWSAPVGMNGTRTVIGSADSPHATPITERQATDSVMEPAA